LPSEPEYLSYAIASVLQVPPGEKQALLEMTDTSRRLERELAILEAEIEAQDALKSVVGLDASSGDSVVYPVDTQELGKFASLN